MLGSSKKILISLFLCLFLVINAYADSDVKTQHIGKCPNGFPSNLLTDFCYKCFFPLRIGGWKVFSYGGIADDVDGNPAALVQNVNQFYSDAASLAQINGVYDLDPANIDVSAFNPGSPICFCKEKQLYHVGVYVSFWDPARISEVILRPGCFPTLFGMEMDFGDADFGVWGDIGDPKELAFGEGVAQGHYTLHYYSFPLSQLLQIIIGFDYCTDYLQSFDALYMSEVDPTHNDDILTDFINPEVFLVTNPFAHLICTIDAITASVGYPINSLFWCAGTWGYMYPLNGNVGEYGQPNAVGSLIAARGLAKLGRLGMELDTSGAGAKCGMSADNWFENMYMPLFKKAQYRMQMLYPKPETKGECCHQIGTSPYLWGEFLATLPTSTEHQIYMIWKKRNCCLKIL